MKLYIYIFTFDRDIDLLEYCLKSTLKVKEKLDADAKLVVTVVNDLHSGESMLNEEKALKMGADRYIETKFDRKGNLNGLACIEGMLRVYVDNTPDDADFVMQLDSDCMLQDIMWAGMSKAYRAELAGQLIEKNDRSFPLMAALGSGMLLTKRLCLKILTLLENVDIRRRIDDGPGNSDVMLNVLTDMLRMCSVKYSYEEPPEIAGRKIRMAQYYTLGGISNDKFLKESCIVHVDRANAGNSHAMVLKGMKEWYDKYVSRM